MFRSALPRGERRESLEAPVLCTSFDPRSRAGSDSVMSWRMETRKSFDPRSRAGSDAIFLHGHLGEVGFDPRSRAGSDLTGVVVLFVTSVSIRAPARGATRQC